MSLPFSHVTQANEEALAKTEARLLGRSIIKKIVARNGSDAYWVVRPDGETREFCYDDDDDNDAHRTFGSNKSTMFSFACAFAGAGAKHDF